MVSLNHEATRTVAFFRLHCDRFYRLGLLFIVPSLALVVSLCLFRVVFDLARDGREDNGFSWPLLGSLLALGSSTGRRLSILFGVGPLVVFKVVVVPVITAKTIVMIEVVQINNIPNKIGRTVVVMVLMMVVVYRNDTILIIFESCSHGCRHRSFQLLGVSEAIPRIVVVIHRRWHWLLLLLSRIIRVHR